MIYQFAGYLAGILMLVSYVPYIRDILRKKTKPERMSWFLWTVLAMVSFFMQLSAGASYSLYLAGAQVLGQSFVFILSIKNGYGGFMKRDVLGLAGVCVSLLVWRLFDAIGIGMLIVIIIDNIGGILTILKSYEVPFTETKISWVLSGLGGLLGCVAVGSFNIILLAIPAYTFSMNFAIYLSILLGLKRELKLNTPNQHG